MKKILVPVDGSAASQKAAVKAAEIARQFGASITFITVILEPDLSKYNKFGVLIDPDMKKLKEKLKENEKKMLDSVINSLDLSDVQTSEKVIAGVAYEEILKEAEEGNYDMIVIGQRGFTKVKRFFLGSVAYRVVSDAVCPVLVVHE
ncbi:universal stress protein [Sedimentibacter sp. B4]|uniref:universal stress protein n=1 Tax=Sedimentibacter sp. B4 TaxID=304766 RepID=UPI00031CF423|nr:universal stress protein [Sedimentibacter sp. B4]